MCRYTLPICEKKEKWQQEIEGNLGNSNEWEIGTTSYTYLILRETPWGTPTLTVAPRTLCRLIFLSAPYSTTVPKNPDLHQKRKVTTTLPIIYFNRPVPCTTIIPPKLHLIETLITLEFYTRKATLI